MPIVVVFLIFVVCLVIAIPVSISLGIVSVLPGAFDPSFTASAQFVIRSMFGGIDSFPLLAVPMFVFSGIVMAKGGISKRLFDVFRVFSWKKNCGNAVRSDYYMFVLWCNIRFGPGYCSGGWKYDNTDSDGTWI